LRALILVTAPIVLAALRLRRRRNEEQSCCGRQ
jgi:hypothetical protein